MLLPDGQPPSLTHSLLPQGPRFLSPGLAHTSPRWTKAAGTSAHFQTSPSSSLGTAAIAWQLPGDPPAQQSHPTALPPRHLRKVLPAIVTPAARGNVPAFLTGFPLRQGRAGVHRQRRPWSPGCKSRAVERPAGPAGGYPGLLPSARFWCRRRTPSFPALPGPGLKAASPGGPSPRGCRALPCWAPLPSGALLRGGRATTPARQRRPPLGWRTDTREVTATERGDGSVLPTPGKSLWQGGQPRAARARLYRPTRTALPEKHPRQHLPSLPALVGVSPFPTSSKSKNPPKLVQTEASCLLPRARETNHRGFCILG